MKNYDIVVATSEGYIDIQPSMFLDLTVGEKDVEVKFIKTPLRKGNAAEEGDFFTFKAGGHYQIKVRKGAIWGIVHKADEASTLAVKAMNDQLIVVSEPTVEA